MTDNAVNLTTSNSNLNNSSQIDFYPKLSPQADYPEIEKRVLAFWEKEQIFQKSLASNPKILADKSNQYLFYDGPPFANGLPHYGHLLTGYVKDIVPRFQTMRGKHVERRFGWDCHGLPAEMEAEKELKISGRLAIEKYGINNFNQYCQKSVLKYANEWESYVTRQARWVDFKDSYKTMDTSYMESVLWAFKQLWDKGLIYESKRVLPYSWACQTPLSNFEIRMDNATRPRQDPALTVAFTLAEDNKTKFLIWTTTPWTLPSNLGLAVGADIDYVKVKKGDLFYILAEEALIRYKDELPAPEIVDRFKGNTLVGFKYQPLFPYFKEKKPAFFVMTGDFVVTGDGTGIVHIAPGFGEDDQLLCEKHGIEIVCPVDDGGCFTEAVGELVGKQVFDANREIIKGLKEHGLLIRHDSYVHNYPHCWRTDTPIIYRAMSSWYVKVTQFKERMLELNQKITWIPDHVRDGQFGKWLENVRDWSISRNRFWGSPIPVWKSDNPQYPRVDVYGSLAELEKDFGIKLNDLHRPTIDQLTRSNPDDPSGKSTMRRVPEVLDCWFESGSMPFAERHYPFENLANFHDNFPADFIVEYIAQTRGWFYTLMVLSTALFDKPPFKKCICHGIVLDENGTKLSKRLRNYPDPLEMFEKYGSDTLRWYLVSSPILRGQNLNIERDGRCFAEVVRTILNPIWNSLYFFTLYANSDGVRADFSFESNELLDCYIMTKLKILSDNLQNNLESLELAQACQEIRDFLDLLNNWYIRRSRERFWRSLEHSNANSKSNDEKLQAYNTLYTVLLTLSKLIAPLLPLISEEIYHTLTGRSIGHNAKDLDGVFKESVHLESWPDLRQIKSDQNLAQAMDIVREVCSKGLSLREKFSLRTRLPLAKLKIAGVMAASLNAYQDLIKDELNVKEIVLINEVKGLASYNLQINFRTLGPKIGSKIKDVTKASKAGEWQLNSDNTVSLAGVIIDKNDFVLNLVPHHQERALPLSSNQMVIELDIQLTPELIAEGRARDVVRAVQQARKEGDFNISDRIKIFLDTDQETIAACNFHLSYLTQQTLADSVSFKLDEAPKSGFNSKGQLENGELSIVISKV